MKEVIQEVEEVIWAERRGNKGNEGKVLKVIDVIHKRIKGNG